MTPPAKIPRALTDSTDSGETLRTGKSFSTLDYSPSFDGELPQQAVTDEIRRMLDLAADAETVVRGPSKVTHAASFDEPTEGKVAVSRVWCSDKTQCLVVAFIFAVVKLNNLHVWKGLLGLGFQTITSHFAPDSRW